MKSHTRLPWEAVLLVLAACPGSPPSSTGSSSDSTEHAPTVHSTPITTDETWHARDNPHVVHGVLTVGGTSATLASGAGASPTLTLEAGVEVRFDEDSQLIVDHGALKAPGTAEQPIRLVANQSAPTPGFWRGLLFNESAGESLLEHVLVSDCGREVKGRPGGCLEVVNRTLVTRDLLVRNSATNGVSLGDDGGFGAGSARLSVAGCKIYPVALEADHADTLPLGGTFTDNGVNAIALFNGVSHSQTWPNLGIPYDILGPEMSIEGTASAPTTLTLSAGTVLRFSTTSLTVGAGRTSEGPGDLIVKGTEEAPVRFTSVSGRPGGWGGITLGRISSATRISHAIIEYAGSSFGAPGNLNLSGGASCTDCPTLDHVTLQKSSAYGLTLQNGGRLGSGSTGVTIRDNASHAIAMSADDVGSLPVGVTLTLIGNLHDSVGVSGDVMHSQTWNNLGLPYDLLGPLTVSGFTLTPTTPTTLTLAAGTVLRFASQATLDVGLDPYDTANLIVNGTEEAPVRFTSSSSLPRPGDWGGVNLRGSTTSTARISHAIIEYAGRSRFSAMTGNLNVSGLTSLTTLDHVVLQKSSAYGMVLSAGPLAPGSTAVTVRDNGSHAIRARADVVGSLPADMTFGGNSPDAVQVSDDGVYQTQTWRDLGVPYILTGSLSVRSYLTAATLTLAPGVELRFPQYAELSVDAGILRAVGTATAPIRFVPDTATPSKGFWRGVHLGTLGNRIDYAFISSGGASGRSLQGNLNVYYEDGGFVTHSTFSNGGTCGIMVVAASSISGVTTDFTLPMYNNTFLDNATAAQCSN